MLIYKLTLSKLNVAILRQLLRWHTLHSDVDAYRSFFVSLNTFNFNHYEKICTQQFITCTSIENCSLRRSVYTVLIP